MWLFDYITKNATKKSTASFADITGGENGLVFVNSSHEQRDVPVVVPYGIAYNPPRHAESVIVESANTPVCIGVVLQANELEEGEIMLFSKGGATLKLKNDGTVEINGKVFG